MITEGLEEVLEDLPRRSDLEEDENVVVGKVSISVHDQRKETERRVMRVQCKDQGKGAMNVYIFSVTLVDSTLSSGKLKFLPESFILQ